MKRISCGLTLLLIAQFANADDMRDCNSGAEEMAIPRPEWLLTWENDSLLGPYHSDEFYTQGMQFGYRMRPDRQPGFLSWAMEHVCRSLAAHSEPDHQKLVGTGSVFLGQHFFTPGDISKPELIEDDRAYAAWLYIGARLELAQKFDTPGRLFKGVFHTFEFQFGSLGPRAQGGWVQSRWHEIRHKEIPRGWANELPNEVGVQLRYTVRGVVTDLPVDIAERSKWQLQGTLDGDFNLGTVLDSASVGTTWRFGRNLGDPISLGLEPAFKAFNADEKAAGSYVDENYQRRANAESKRTPCLRWLGVMECYVFAGVAGHAFARNAFLDGTLWHGGHSVDKEPFVYDYVAGLRLGGRQMQFDFTETWRSREFSPVPATAQVKSGRHGFFAANLRCFAPINNETHGWDFVCPVVFSGLLTAIATR